MSEIDKQNLSKWAVSQIEESLDESKLRVLLDYVGMYDDIKHDSNYNHFRLRVNALTFHHV